MRLVNLNSVHIHTVYEPPLSLGNLDIIPAHLPLPHLAISRESPVLEPIAPLPFHFIRTVLVFVPELHGYLVFREREELFAQAVGLFFRPFGGQEIFDGGSSL